MTLTPENVAIESKGKEVDNDYDHDDDDDDDHDHARTGVIFMT